MDGLKIRVPVSPLSVSMFKGLGASPATVPIGELYTAQVAAVATVVGWGEDPADYVTTEIRVPESRFTAWPPRIRAVFEPARTVATGNPRAAANSPAVAPYTPDNPVTASNP